jgi:hypothetical protein
MAPIYFTPIYRVVPKETDNGWHLSLQRSFLFFWRTVKEIEINLNSGIRINHNDVEYWPWNNFNINKRAANMWLEWIEKNKT